MIITGVSSDTYSPIFTNPFEIAKNYFLFGIEKLDRRV